MLLRARCAAVLAVVLVTAVACSGDDGDGGSSGTNRSGGRATTAPEPIGTDASGAPITPPPVIETSPSDRVGCTVNVTGDLQDEFTGKDDDQAFASDHYFSEVEVESILGHTAAEGQQSTLPGEEPDVTIPPRAEGSALVTAWFLLNCQGGDTTFSVYSNPVSTKDDVPFGPKEYAVVPARADNKPDDFFAFIVFGANPESIIWEVDEGAKLTVETFDQHGASGSFHVPMVEVPTDPAVAGRHVVVDGEFDVTCKQGANCAG